MSPPAPGAMLSGRDIEAITGLLKVIAGWLDNAGPAVHDNLRAHLRRHGAGLRAGDLPGQIAWLSAMLRYRQITGGTR